MTEPFSALLIAKREKKALFASFFRFEVTRVLQLCKEVRGKEEKVFLCFSWSNILKGTFVKASRHVHKPATNQMFCWSIKWKPLHKFPPTYSYANFSEASGASPKGTNSQHIDKRNQLSRPVSSKKDTCKSVQTQKLPQIKSTVFLPRFTDGNLQESFHLEYALLETFLKRLSLPKTDQFTIHWKRKTK